MAARGEAQRGAPAAMVAGPSAGTTVAEAAAELAARMEVAAEALGAVARARAV